MSRTWAFQNRGSRGNTRAVFFCKKNVLAPVTGQENRQDALLSVPLGVSARLHGVPKHGYLQF